MLDRFEILNAILTALDERVRVLDVVAEAPTLEEVRAGLVSSFAWSDVQVEAVLHLQVFRFNQEMRHRITAERDGLAASIRQVES